MTQNRLGWNLYWLYALYLGAIPPFVIMGLMQLLKAAFSISISVSGLLYFGLWAISAVLLGILIEKPYHKSYNKYNWEYDGKKIYNPHENIEMQVSEIDDLYLGIIKKPAKYERYLKYFGYEYVSKMRSMSQKTALVIVMKTKKICFLQIALLQNGQRMQEKIINDNRDKLSEKPFEIGKGDGLIQRIKWYRLLEIEK